MQISLKNTKDNKNWISINFIWAVIVFTPIGLTYLPTVPQYSIIRKKVHFQGNCLLLKRNISKEKVTKKTLISTKDFLKRCNFVASLTLNYPVISKNFTKFSTFLTTMLLPNQLTPCLFCICNLKMHLCLGDYVFSNLLVTLFTKHFNDISLYILQKHTIIIFSSFIYWRYIITVRLHWKKFRHMS